MNRLLVFIAVAFTANAAAAQSKDNSPKLKGICFSGIRDGESPALRINPLPSTVRQDVEFASRVTTAIRTYSVQGSNYLIPEFCQEFGVDCVVGAWIGKSRWQNDAQIELLIRLASGKNRRIRSVIVGNEVLHRGDCTPDQLIAYVRRVREAVDVPVGVAETWKAWVDHPELIAEVDFCAVQAYPYWEGLPLDGAAAYTVERLKQIRRMANGKPIVLSEFGWPTSGESKGRAVASPANAARYLREIIPLLDTNKFEYYYFSLWDEKWKVGAEGGVGAHWGLFQSDGGPKPPLMSQLPAGVRTGSKRPPRQVTFQLKADAFRNADVVRVAYPQPGQATKPAPSAERGPGLQSIKGSGVRLELPKGQGPAADSAEATRDEPDCSPIPDDTGDKPTVPSRLTFTEEELDRRFKKPRGAKKLYGLCLSLFRDNETPHFGVTPLVSEIRADIQQAKKLANFVRTYSVADSFSLAPELCAEIGVDCLPGAALGKYPWLNEMEIEMLIRVGQANNPRVKAVIVGNEVMHRGDFSLEQYVDYIRRVKQAVKTPVATAELLHTWLEHPELAKEVDIIGVQIYPFWGGLSIDRAAEDTLLRVKELQAKYPGKRVLLTEFGWPSAGGTIGGAVASPENAARYYREVIPLLDKAGIEYFYFAMTDEKWKAGDEGGPGAHWGLLDSIGEVKPALKSLLPSKAGMKRPPRKLTFDD